MGWEQQERRVPVGHLWRQFARFICRCVRVAYISLITRILWSHIDEKKVKWVIRQQTHQRVSTSRSAVHNFQVFAGLALRQELVMDFFLLGDDQSWLWWAIPNLGVFQPSALNLHRNCENQHSYLFSYDNSNAAYFQYFLAVFHRINFRFCLPFILRLDAEHLHLKYHISLWSHYFTIPRFFFVWLISLCVQPLERSCVDVNSSEERTSVWKKIFFPVLTCWFLFLSGQDTIARILNTELTSPRECFSSASARVCRWGPNLQFYYFLSRMDVSWGWTRQMLWAKILEVSDVAKLLLNRR